MKVKIVDEKIASTILVKSPFPFSIPYAAFARKRGFTYHILCDEAEQIFIPLTISKRRSFYVGIFAHAPITLAGKPTAEHEKEFIDAVTAYCAKELKCMRIEPGSTISVYNTYPAGGTAVELGVFAVDLTRTEDEIFAAFDNKYRTQIRKAEKEGIEVRFGKNEIGAFAQCYADTHKRQGVSYEPQSFFEDMFNTLGEEMVICANAYANGKIEAGVFVVHTAYAGYYMYAGSEARTQLKGSTKKILWDCMKLLKQKGIPTFVLGGARYKNVEGTKFEGIQDFKRRFGAETTDGYIWKKDLNPLLCKLYDALFWVRCRLNGSAVPKDIVDSQL
ncbi:MAG: hypothetical protein RLZZ367_1362 [Bacteroidota bacterium]|jgi:hypothetical protein